MFKWIKNFLYGTRQSKFFKDGDYIVYKSEDGKIFETRDITISDGYIIKNIPSQTQNIIADMFDKFPRGFISPKEPKNKVVFNLDFKQIEEEGDVKYQDVIGNFELHKFHQDIKPTK